MNYNEAWTYLDNLQFFKIKLRLSEMENFLNEVGNPHHRLKFVHIGGTNGKGSVGATLLTLLSRAGYRVGLYTSPHLSSVRERFRINDTFISRDDFAETSARIRTSLGEGRITYFEFTTALALLWFADQGVDLAIMEVGLGGRLDATNVITPLVSVITNVSLDHEIHLGNTVAQVAGEKAGIIKPGVPLISGVEDDGGLEVVSAACREKGTDLHLLGRDFCAENRKEATWDYAGWNGRRYTGLTTRLKGGYQIDNAALSLAVLESLSTSGFEVEEKVVRDGLPRVVWPGRLEYFSSGDRHYLLDGAHNPAGIAALKGALVRDFSYDRLICVWASMSDKDLSTTLLKFVNRCDKIIFTRPEEERSALPEVLQQTLSEEDREKTTCVDGVPGALEAARRAAGERDLICVAGSLYLVGYARQLLLGDVVDQ
ncbi:MAG: bifunctional folylpolyglutamate synthase/dihydrofolate synthase [Desulfurivibrionaceae bacterium]